MRFIPHNILQNLVLLNERTSTVLGSEKFRYGFNGMESDPEVKGDGNNYTTEFRQYDPRIGRWLSPDLLTAIAPGWNPYRFAFNNPIIYTDEDGLYETKREARQARRGASDAGYDVGKIKGTKGNYWFQGTNKKEKEVTVHAFSTKEFESKSGEYNGGIEFYDAVDARGAIPVAQAHEREAFKVGDYTVVPNYIDGKLDHYTTSIAVTDPSTMEETYRYDYIIGRDKLNQFEENVTTYGGAANLAFGANLHLEQYQIEFANENYGAAIGGRLKQEWTDVEAILDAFTSLPAKKPSARSSNFKSSLRNASPQQQKQIRKQAKNRLKKGR